MGVYLFADFNGADLSGLLACLALSIPAFYFGPTCKCNSSYMA